MRLTRAEIERAARASIELSRRQSEASHLAFVRQAYRHRPDGGRFLVSPHHEVISRVIDDIVCGRRTRVIINVPPGYTKTELATIGLMARGLAISPKSRHLHVSYSDDLAILNSSRVQDVVRTPWFQACWPRDLRADAKAKGSWRTAQGGEFQARSSGGQIVGFRAGRMEEGYTGALVIDDPLKTDDAVSKKKLEFINSRYTRVFMSRLAHERVPALVIMQRLNVDDMSGFLLRGGSGEIWDHLELPAIVPAAGSAYPSEYTHGRPIEHGLPEGPLWPGKLNADRMQQMAEADPYTWAAQYQQRPVKLGGTLFREAHFAARWDEDTGIPPLAWRTIYADTAQKTSERNDWSVFQAWGRTTDGRAVLLDQIRGRWEAPDLDREARAFWAKHAAWPAHVYGVLRAMKVEDKASGTGLIQALRRPPEAIPVAAIQRHKDKYTRALDVLPRVAVPGAVVIPDSAPWLAEWLAEVLAFDGAGGSRFDDQVDPMLDACSEILGGGGLSMMDVL